MTDRPGTNLIQTLPLHGRRLIEASAGTGKTYTLAGLYLRLVLGVGGEARMPPDILVLTFTRAATRELRERIRHRLVEAARAFRAGHSQDDNLRWLMGQFAPQRWPACARLLDVAAGWMDEAAIHTIHAWCQTMLRQHAFDSGSLFEQEVDAADPLLLQHALADYWRQWWYGEHPYRHHLNRIVSEFGTFGKQLRELRRAGAVLVAAGRQPEPLSPGDYLNQVAAREAGPGQAVAVVLADWSVEGAAVAGVLRQALENGFYANGRNKAVAATRAALPRLIDELSDWQPGQPFPADLEWLHPGHLESVCKKNKAPEHPWLGRLGGALDEMGGYPDCAARIWAHALESIESRLLAEKQRANRLDFDDLLHHLDQALEAPGGQRLRQTILTQYPIALVDEFQDTDPVQFRIFERLWGRCAADDARHGLFLIGDPKQSIYSFRGADIHAYMTARNQTDSHHSLERNYRSSEAMVSAVNGLFGAGESHPRGAFAFAEPGQAGSMPFEAVQAEGRGEVFEVDGGMPQALTLCYQGPEEGSAALGLTIYRQVMAEQAAEAIARLLTRAASGRAGFRDAKGQSRPLRAADIAVLVRQGNQAELVMRALRKRGVAAVYLSDQDSVFDSDQARELCLVLTAIADPGDERRLRAALATGLFGRSAGELDALNQDEQRIEQEFERFDQLLAVWKSTGVLAMIHRLLDVYDLPARLLGDPRQGERGLTNLLHLAELLQAESQVLEGEQALIHWLGDQVRLDQRGQDDEQQLRLESDAELVRVVTCHAAKGLEYPLVFAPFVCNYRAASQNGALSYHDGQRRVVDLAPDGAARQRAQLESLQEELRLFYVAVTRARHACWLGVAPVLSGKGKGPAALAAFPFGHLLLGLADEVGAPPPMRELLDRLMDRLGPSARLVEVDGLPACTRLGVASTAEPLQPARSYQGRPREHWWIGSYSAIRKTDTRQGADEPQDAAEDQAREEFDTPAEQAGDAAGRSRPSMDRHGFPRGPRAGTFLHGLLEWAGRQGLAETAAAPQAFSEQIERRCRLRGWQAWTRVVEPWLFDLLHQPMVMGDCAGGPALRLADLQCGSYTPELEFWFEASRVDTRSLDRLIQRQTLDGLARKPLAPNQLNGMMRGFIDLVFAHQGRYYVLDYKSNHLGEGASAYSHRAMRDSVLDKRYDLQLAIYTLALHRLLKSRLPGYDYDRHVGGAVFLYLRGCGSEPGGVFHERPPRALIEALHRLFAGSEVEDAA